MCKVFDWFDAARFIREIRVKEAWAGILDRTPRLILMDGRPVRTDGTTIVTCGSKPPVLHVNGLRIICFVEMQVINNSNYERIYDSYQYFLSLLTP